MSENGDKWTMGGQSGRLLRILYAAQGKGACWTNTLEKYFHFCFSKLWNVNSSMWALEGVKAADHWEFSKKEFTENPRSSQGITFGGFQTTYHRLSEIYVNGAALKMRSFMFQRQDSVNMKRSWGPHLMGRFEHMDEWSRTSLLHRSLKKLGWVEVGRQMLEKDPKSQMLDFKLGRLWLTSFCTHSLTHHSIF